MERQERAKPQTKAGGSGRRRPPVKPAATATADFNRAEKVFEIIQTMDQQELTDLAAQVREKLITQ